jgi:DNA-3-methyladenine glycosylase II
MGGSIKKAILQSYKWMYKTDYVLRKSVAKKCKKWKPYSSVVAKYLYRILNMEFTKSEFHLFKE